MLEKCQLAAIRYVDEYVSASRVTSAGPGATDHLSCNEYLRSEYDRVADLLRGNFPVDVHFHPDRIAIDGRAVVDGILNSMQYANQFVSGISNGLLDTSATGNRKRWEGRLFGGSYDDYPDALRPKYGAANLFNSLDGACPRFGSCYLRLKEEINERCTLSYGDSHTQPEHTGTSKSLQLLEKALHEDYSSSDEKPSNGPSLRSISEKLQAPLHRKGISLFTRNLDDIVEVQVHGDLRIDRDVQFVSVDSAFVKTQTGDKLIELALKADIDIRWRPMLHLQVGRVPAGFRGERLIEFIKDTWPSGYVDAFQLGELAKAINLDPYRGAKWGQPHDVLQLIKQTWHAIVAFGEPVDRL